MWEEILFNHISLLLIFVNIQMPVFVLCVWHCSKGAVSLSRLRVKPRPPRKRWAMLLLVTTSLQTCLGLSLNRGCSFSRERGYLFVIFGAGCLLCTRVFSEHALHGLSCLCYCSSAWRFRGKAKKAVMQTGREDKKRPGSSSDHHRGAHLR